jgi:hypothetical protein
MHAATGEMRHAVGLNKLSHLLTFICLCGSLHSDLLEH